MKHLERKADSDMKEKKAMSEKIAKLQRTVEEKAWLGAQDATLCRTCLER